jgi:hypothetical protein
LGKITVSNGLIELPPAVARRHDQHHRHPAAAPTKAAADVVSVSGSLAFDANAESTRAFRRM